MGRKSIKYNESELSRTKNYMIVLAGPEIPTEIRDLVEASDYLKNPTGFFNEDGTPTTRKVAIFNTNEEYQKYASSACPEFWDPRPIRYDLVRNWSKKLIRQINHSKESPEQGSIDKLLVQLKNALVIIGPNKFTPKFFTKLLEVQNTGIDVMAHRGTVMDFALMNREELMSATSMRIHGHVLDFGNPETIQRIMGSWCEKHQNQNPDTLQNALAIVIATFIASWQYKLSSDYIKKITSHVAEQAPDDMDSLLSTIQIDYRVSQPVYVDLINGKVLGVDLDTYKMATEKIKSMYKMEFDMMELYPTAPEENTPSEVIDNTTVTA